MNRLRELIESWWRRQRAVRRLAGFVLLGPAMQDADIASTNRYCSTV